MQKVRKLGVVIFVLLFVASCAPAAPTATPAKPAPAAPAPTPAAPAAPAIASPTAAPKPAATPTPAVKVKRGGTLVRIDVRDASSWDPAFSTNSSEVAECSALEAFLRWELVDEKTGKHEAKPWLAESWQLVDPKTLVLKLRKGVKFHDGSEFNAEAAKWYLDRNRTHAKSLAKGNLGAIDSVDAVDASTLKLNLKFSSPTVFLNLTNAAGGTGSTGTLVTSKVAFEKLGEEAIGRKPVGTGPFVMEEWKRDDRTTYKRWDQYWKQGEDGKALPYLDGIEVRVLRDRAVGIIELRTGTAHVIMNIDAKDIAGVKANPDMGFLSMPWAADRRTVTFNSGKSPFGTNLKLRQAAQHGIDKAVLAKTIGLEYGIPGDYIVWLPGMLGWDEKNPKYEFNEEKAKQLLKEAGFPDGVGLGLATSPEMEQPRIAEIMQAMWVKVGIRTVINVMESAAFKAAAQAGAHEAALSGAFPSPDTDGFSRLFVCEGSANWGSYCNPEVDKCMAEGRSVYDEKQRDEIYKRCQKILYEDAGVVGTRILPWNAVWRKEVRNLRTNFHLADLREIWLDK